MGFFANRTAYWQALAEKHTSLLDGPTQRSFFRMNGADEFDADIFNKCHRNVVVLMDFSGNYELDSDEADRVVRTQLHFYSKATDSTATAMEAAKDAAFVIMEDFVARILNDAAYENCPAIGDVDSVTFTEAPQHTTLFFGWALSITDKPTISRVEYTPAKWTDET